MTQDLQLDAFQAAVAQIAGRCFDEPTVLRVAGAYQHATDSHVRAPEVHPES